MGGIDLYVSGPDLALCAALLAAAVLGSCATLGALALAALRASGLTVREAWRMWRG